MLRRFAQFEHVEDRGTCRVRVLRKPVETLLIWTRTGTGNLMFVSLAVMVSSSECPSIEVCVLSSCYSPPNSFNYLQLSRLR